MFVGLILGKGIAGTMLLSFNFDVSSNIPLVTGLLYSANDNKESNVFLVSSIRQFKDNFSMTIFHPITSSLETEIMLTCKNIIFRIIGDSQNISFSFQYKYFVFSTSHTGNAP